MSQFVPNRLICVRPTCQAEFDRAYCDKYKKRRCTWCNSALAPKEEPAKVRLAN